MSVPIRLGTRQSTLALAQSRTVADALTAATGRPVELVHLVSEGDTSRASLSQLGGTGVFATRLREALAEGECDILVHSLKDLPTAPAAGLVIAATPTRASAADVVITRDGTALRDLAAGAVVGTGSPRRMAQVLRANAGVDIRDIRGNIDSRANRVRTGELDVIILAEAGLARAGVAGDLRHEVLDIGTWPTAPGQGALAVEARADAPAWLIDGIRVISDPETELAVAAERQVLATLEAGCHAPVGASARVEHGELSVHAVVYGADVEVTFSATERTRLDPRYIRRQGAHSDAARADGDGARVAAAAGERLAVRLLRDGAADEIGG